MASPIPMLNHLFNSMMFHAGFSFKAFIEELERVDDHHVAEDLAIAVGRALKQALGSAEGIARFGWAAVPMDESLVLAAVDVSGRGAAYVDLPFKREQIGGLSTECIPHIIESMAREAGITVHVKALAAGNDHHLAEAAFKALGKALSQALSLKGKGVPSTKGVIG